MSQFVEGQSKLSLQDTTQKRSFMPSLKLGTTVLAGGRRKGKIHLFPETEAVVYDKQQNKIIRIKIRYHHLQLQGTSPLLC
jgi:hypothetical protein